MRNRARPLVTLLIAPHSPLAGGRLPRGATEQEGGVQARFDPVSYAALRASLGEFIPLQEVQAMFEQAIRKTLENRPAADAAAPGAEGEAA